MLVGQAIAETASIFALIIAMLLLFPSFSVISPLMIATYLAAGLCMGLGAIGSGIGSGLPTAEACIGIERQPGMKNRIHSRLCLQVLPLPRARPFLPLLPR
ncbi:MAG: hypothetical protein R2861_12280 [Desulfobacterales bacterium]